MDLLSPEAVADELNVSTKTVYRWIQAGKLPAQKVGQQWRVARQALNAFKTGKVDDFIGAESLIRAGRAIFRRPLPNRSDYDPILAALVAKAVKDLRAAVLLTRHGFGDAVCAMARMLLETAVTALYIAKKPEERAERYTQWERVRKAWLAPIIRKADPTAQIDYERVQKEAEAVGDLFRDAKRVESWSGVSLNKMAEEIGFESFAWLYPSFSDRVHPNVFAASSHLREDAGQLQVLVDLAPEQGPGGLTAGCIAALMLFDHANDHWALDLAEELREAKDDLGIDRFEQDHQGVS